MSIVKNTPAEILQKHILEPSLRTIYVEGNTDKELIHWFLEEIGLNKVNVLEISSVDIPSVLVSSGGNRERVIYLSKYINANCLDLIGLTFIADRDLETIFAGIETNNFILYTDFCCIEMYFFEETILKKFFKLGCRLRINNLDAIMQNFILVLHELFLIRAANLSLSWNLRKLNFLSSCRIKKNEILFDRGDYIKKYLQLNIDQLRKIKFGTISTNKKLDWSSIISEFENEIEHHRKLLEGPARLYINGHDFLNLLAAYVNDNSLKKVIQEGNLLLTTVEVEHLQGYKMFQDLIKRCS
jgi:hypothetical protein